jgi:hypothetical protein
MTTPKPSMVIAFEPVNKRRNAIRINGAHFIGLEYAHEFRLGAFNRCFVSVFAVADNPARCLRPFKLGALSRCLRPCKANP